MNTGLTLLNTVRSFLLDRKRITRLSGNVRIMLMLATGSIVGGEESGPGPVYHLFVGHRVWVEKGGEVLSIKDWDNTSLVLEHDGQTEIAEQNRAGRIGSRPEVKLSPELMVFEDLESKSAWNLSEKNQRISRDMENSRSPIRELERQMQVLDSQTYDPGITDAGVQAIETKMAELEVRLDELREQHTERFDYMMDGRADEEAADRGMNNAIDVSAKISLPRAEGPVRLVWMCLVSEPESGRLPARHIRFDVLAHVGPEPVKYSTQLTGFPEGFEIEEIKVAAFVGEREVATTLSERRFELTEAQAREYLITDYIGGHRRATLAPSPLRLLAPSALPSQVDLSVVERLVVKVSPEGVVEDVRMEDDHSEADAADYSAVLASWVFYPALVDGKPVEGEFRGTLSDLW